MRWFGFGFNAFRQVHIGEGLTEGDNNDPAKQVRVENPTEVCCHSDGSCMNISEIKASWSRRASLHLDGKIRPSEKQL